MSDEPRYVRGEGNRYSKIMIVGEAPGYYEEQYGVPFYPNAPSGGELAWYLSQCGLSRSEVYLTNVLKYRPPNNNWKELKETNKGGLEESLKILTSEIEMINPNVIIAVGERALQALCNDKYKMRQWRGSVIESKTIYPKVVPMYHPSVYLHEKGGKHGRTPFPYIWRYINLFDFKRAVKESKTKEIVRPYRLLSIAKDFSDVYRFFEENKNKPYISIDIEASGCFPFCIGLSCSSERAISIPLFSTISGSTISNFNSRDLARTWRILAERLPQYQTIGQNFKYDQDKLEKLGFRIGPLYIDTLLLGHAINPEFPIKKLEFFTSYYTDEPYYKDEGKGYHPKKDKIDRLLLYNAKDAAVTYEIAERMEDEAKEIGVWNYYYTRRRLAHEFYLRLENRGFKLDYMQRKRIYKKYRLLQEANSKTLNEILGRTDFKVTSNPQIHQALFQTLGLPLRTKADEDTLVALLANHAKLENQKIFIQGILDGRRIQKTIGTYIKAKPDFDGRMRTSFNIVGTVTGRSSTRKLRPPIRPLYPTGTKKKGKAIGLAFHTLTKHGKLGPDLRSYLTPDEGMVLFEIDKKQAEAYVVFLLSEDYEMLQRLKDPSFDIHTETTMLVLSLPREEARKKEPRFIGKTCRHMGAYDSHKHKLMLEINTGAKKFGIKVEVSEWKAGKLLDKFHQGSPNIRKVFHPSVIEALENNNRTLTNPYGAKITFHERWDDDLFRSAYAWIPQSTIPEHVRECALKTQQIYPDIQMIIEAHDAIIGQCRPDEVKDISKVLLEEFSAPIDFSQCSIKRGLLHIPNDISIYTKSYDPKNAISLEDWEKQYV